VNREPRIENRDSAPAVRRAFWTAAVFCRLCFSRSATLICRLNPDLKTSRPAIHDLPPFTAR
jgi:hypothetical protein